MTPHGRISWLYKRCRNMGVVQFDTDCNGLLAAIARVSNPVYQAYEWYGKTSAPDVWLARYVMREARKIGLYPTTAQLEQEARKAA